MRPGRTAVLGGRVIRVGTCNLAGPPADYDSLHPDTGEEIQSILVDRDGF
jgi:hypothetical protein